MMKRFTPLAAIVLLTLGLTACPAMENNDPSPTGNTVTYQLVERDVDGISGSITFNEFDDGSTEAVIELTGTPADGEHPAHIHANSAAEGGSIVVTFTPVDGDTGRSTTTITQTDDGTELTYADILTYDGYVNVHRSAADLGTIVAQGDIGANAFTGEATTYTLEERAVAGISGTITFEELVGGFTQATINLMGTPAGGEHPAHIHENSAAEGGPIVVTFTPVDGDTGSSTTIITQTDDGTELTYADILAYDGYVNVHSSAEDLGTIVAQGNIGSNIMNGDPTRTGNATTYQLAERDVDGISGSVTFNQFSDGSTEAVIELTGTPADGEHPAHIHANSAAEGGPIVVTFTPVDGDTGRSTTTFTQTDDGTELTYADILTYDGYVNVHRSADDLGTIVAQGDIGSNATP